MVDQLVVVRRAIHAKAVGARAAADPARQRQRGRHLPVTVAGALRSLDVDETGAVGTPLDGQEDAGAVEETVGLVEMRGAHRQIPGINLVMQAQRAAGPQRRGAPAVLVELLHAPRLAIDLGPQAHDVARELADHVAARDPRRQAENLASRIGIAHGAADLEQVGTGMGGTDAVFDGGQRGGRHRAGIGRKDGFRALRKQQMAAGARLRHRRGGGDSACPDTASRPARAPRACAAGT